MQGKTGHFFGLGYVRLHVCMLKYHVNCKAVLVYINAHQTLLKQDSNITIEESETISEEPKIDSLSRQRVPTLPIHHIILYIIQITYPKRLFYSATETLRSRLNSREK